MMDTRLSYENLAFAYETVSAAAEALKRATHEMRAIGDDGCLFALQRATQIAEYAFVRAEQQICELDEK